MHKDAHEIMVTRSQEKRTRHEFVKNSQKAFREFPSPHFPLRAARSRGEPSERKLDGNIPPGGRAGNLQTVLAKMATVNQR